MHGRVYTFMCIIHQVNGIFCRSPSLALGADKGFLTKPGLYHIRALSRVQPFKVLLSAFCAVPSFIAMFFVITALLSFFLVWSVRTITCSLCIFFTVYCDSLPCSACHARLSYRRSLFHSSCLCTIRATPRITKLH